MSIPVSGNIAIKGPRPWIDVTAAPYSAVGDGSTDDTAALNAAFADLPTVGGTLFFPPGTEYKVTSGLSWVDKTATISARGAIIDFYGTLPSTVAVTAATNAAPIQITTGTVHGRSTGDLVFISGVVGNTFANGWWVVTKVDNSNFTLNGSVGNGAWVSGGLVYLQAAALTVGYSAGSATAGTTAAKGWKVDGLTVRWQNGGGSNFLSNPFTGIVAQNVYAGQLDVSVYGMGIGLQLRGDGTGSTLSTHRIGTLSNNGIQLHAFATNTGGTNGFVTEQTIIGGDLQWSSAQGTWANQVWQFKAETGAVGGGTVNVAAVRFLGTSFQCNSGGANVVARYDMLSGDHFHFLDCRYESSGHVVMPMRWASTTFNNKVLGTSGAGAGISDLQIIDEASGNTQNAGFAYDQTFSRVFTATTNVSVSTTNAETTFVPAGSGSVTLPAYFFHRAATLMVKAHGLYSTLASAQGNITIKFKLGSIVWTSGSLALPASAGNWWWELEAEITHRVYGTGGNGRIVGWVKVLLQNGAAGAGTSPLFLPIALTSTVIDDSAAQIIDSTVIFSVGDAANVWDCEMYRVWKAD